jgi:tetratricopeptide (TPR) repeat protein
VVYTLTLPPTAHNPKEQAARPTPKTVSDWDRIRGELHNEKPKGQDKEQPHKEPSLAEIILKVLAENGRHFGQLGDDESLIVIVTFRGGDPPPAKAADPDKPKTHQGASQAPSAEDKAKAALLQGSTSNAHDYELLAELHLKQGKYEEAVKAYQQALELNPGAKQAAALYRKLAEAYLGLGKDAEARQAIDKAMELAKVGQAEAAEPVKQPKATRSPLPAKLIISAPKKLLDQVGSGKITPEEFQKAATVDYLTFPGEKE